MAVALTLSRSKRVTLATTVTRLTGLDTGQEISITAPAGADVYIVDDPAVADGAALPADYYTVYAGTSYVYPLGVAQTYIGVAGSVAGVASVRAL